MRPAFIILWLFSAVQVVAQTPNHLLRKLERAPGVEMRIRLLDSLSIFYFTSGADSMGEMYAQRKYLLARSTRHKPLEALALYTNGASRLLHGGRFTEAQARSSADWLTRAVKLAQQENLPYYEAASYLRLAELHLQPAGLDIGKSLEYAHLAQNLASSLSNDSLHILSQLAIASVHAYKKNSIIAFRYLANAMKMEQAANSYAVRHEIYHAFSQFYSSLNDLKNTIVYAEKALRLSQDNEPVRHEEVYENLFQMGRIYFDASDFEMSISYFQQAYEYAKKHVPEHSKLAACLARIHTAFFRMEAYGKADSLDRAHPELLTAMQMRGLQFLRYNNLAEKHMRQKQYDSAAYYSALAASHPNVTPTDRYIALDQMARVNLLSGNYRGAALVADSMLKIAQRAENLEHIKTSYNLLDTAYFLMGDFENAYRNKFLHNVIRDSIQALNQERALSLLEVSIENERVQMELQREQERVQRRHQLQYIAITVVTALVFLLLVLMGVFSSSRFIIKAFGFFAFILLFEFVILIADHKIHAWTHGEPWKVLAIKIGLIAILFPLHHYLEAKVVHHLINRTKVQWTFARFLRKPAAQAKSKS